MARFPRKVSSNAFAWYYPSAATERSFNICVCLPGELLTVTREPGEKLGFGLKFYGGNSGSNEPVKKLFIQSCAANT